MGGKSICLLSHHMAYLTTPLSLRNERTKRKVSKPSTAMGQGGSSGVMASHVVLCWFRLPRIMNPYLFARKILISNCLFTMNNLSHLLGFQLKEDLSFVLFCAIAFWKTCNLAIHWLKNRYMNHNLHYIGINPALISSFSQLPLMPSLCDKLLHAVLFPSSEECGAHNGGGVSFVRSDRPRPSS